MDIDIDGSSTDASIPAAPTPSPSCPTPSTDPQPTNISTPSQIARLESLQSQFTALTLQADALFRNQVHVTQRKLGIELKEIHHQYSQHGSQARLSDRMLEFLSKEDKTLRYIDVFETEEEAVKRKRNGLPGKEDTTRSGKLRPNPRKDTLSNSSSSQPSNLTPLALVRLHHRLNDPSPPHLAYTTDAETTLDILPQLPFNPCALTLTLPDNLSIPTPLLSALNTILNLHTSSARTLLHQLTHHHPTLPPALLRLGITELWTSRLSHIFTSASDHELGLTPEARVFLREMYELYPGGLNLAEKRMVAQVARVGTETVEVFWEDMAVKRRAWAVLRALVARGEVKRAVQAKDQGRYR